VQTLLTYVLGLLLVGGLLFLAASFAFGRGEQLAPTLPEGTPVELPDDRPAGGDDLRALRLSVVLRGYRMDEVDWVLDRLAEQLDTRDREVARLRSVLHVEPVPVGGTAADERIDADARAGLLTHAPRTDPGRLVADEGAGALTGAGGAPEPRPAELGAGTLTGSGGAPEPRPAELGAGTDERPSPGPAEESGTADPRRADPDGER
jgi:DivIVA domain-containing protein